jgi:hypothetical protein
MAKLTTKSRKKVPAKEFGEPGKRAYPMPDKARAAQMLKKGKLSESEKKKIDAKTNKKLRATKKR